jgi:pyrimidine operon attenuation protein/uracil phosphoribosyltransferase
MAGEDLSDELIALASELCNLQEDFALIGIYTGGAYLASRLQRLIGERLGTPPDLGTMDITLYRDDLYTGLEHPILGATEIPFDITDRGIVLVDDVLFTGRTVRAALNQLMDYGRPRWVKLLVLIDRGHRELPIAPDFVGAVIKTNKRDRVRVKLVEAGAAEDVVSLQYTKEQE